MCPVGRNMYDNDEVIPRHDRTQFEVDLTHLLEKPVAFGSPRNAQVRPRGEAITEIFRDGASK